MAENAPASPEKPLQIGLAGFGNVGAGVYKNLVKNRDLLRQRTGRALEVRRVVVRDPARPREIALPEGLVSTDLNDLVNDDAIDIVVELIGGTDRAFDLVKAALERRKTVVTGNKALLAERGRELFELAERQKTPIYFEAAVAGGIPIIRTVQESLVGNHIESVTGIVNGTSNYILTRMAEAGLDYREALAEAQQLGYAEADPTLDVNGWDAAHKAIILASLSYGSWLRSEEIFVEGIENLTRRDIDFAGHFGYTVKLLAVIQLHAESGSIEVRVQPSLISKSHILASVKGAFNAILVRGDVVGETLFYGSGAGQDPTSSSVISDIADAAVWRDRCEGHTGFVPHGLYGKPLPVDESVSKYYLRVEADDRPGVLAQIARVLGDHGIGILSVNQPEQHDTATAPIVLMLHFARFGVVREALRELTGLGCVKEAPVLMRVEKV
ncbi:MAG: homoserine dehydrogenase [Verrucomicrobiae bacterium]|nr:homoserine dehydrogenase [Verrucomicrobiae bacterium]MCP5549643.1 homoserine dehydrogenase [Akkermansiaceae bacterium]